MDMRNSKNYLGSSWSVQYISTMCCTLAYLGGAVMLCEYILLIYWSGHSEI